MKDIKHNVMFKVIVIFILILILLIPTTMIENLIHERESINLSAIEEVSAKWGKGQTITGPYISIPYNVFTIEHLKNNKTEKKLLKTEWIHVLPDELSIEGEINPEKRYRGIHEVVVYQSHLEITGKFKAPRLAESTDSLIDILYEKSTLNLGITDLKGIEKQISLLWNNNEINFNSGLSTNDIAESGINTVIPITIFDSLNYKFSMNLDLMGSQHLFFIPLGKTTDVN